MSNERIVHEIMPGHWDINPYSVACEIKSLIKSMADASTSIDSGAGDGVADLWLRVCGEEYHICVRRSGANSASSDVVFDVSRLRTALETAADALFDAGLNDAWAEARAALGERT